MAWAIRTDGVNDALIMASEASVAVGETLTIRTRARSGNLDGAYRLIGRTDGFTSLIELSSSDINVRLDSSTNNFVNTGYTQPALETWFTLELERLTTTTYEVRLDGAVIGQVAQASNNDFKPNQIARFNTNREYSGDTEYVTIGSSHNWNATTSSHAAGTPVLIDTIGGNDATGINMPTDGSAWIDLGGAITVTESTVSANYNVNNPTVTLTGAISITESTANTNYTSLNPTISFTGSVSIAEQATNTNYEVNNPTITLSSTTIEITESTVNTQYTANNPSILLTPEPLGIVSTVCFNGVLVDLDYSGTSNNLIYNGQLIAIEFNGDFNELEFNGTIQTKCSNGSIKTNC